MKKTRLDVYLTENGLAPSREIAKAYIMEGSVYINNQKADKAGMPVPEDANVELRGKKMPYVSRGGYKLEKAIKEFDIVLTDFICMDVGASTGGFTDCMLMNGAKKVYSVDVGYGQLAWKLRCDERVVNLERTNARYLTDEQITDKLDFISVDASFISLKLLIPVIKEFLKDKDGSLKGVKIVKLLWEKDAASGRMIMKEIPGSEQVLEAQLVLIAAGFLGSEKYVTDAFGVEVNERTNVKTAPGSYATNVENVFVTGDMHRGQSLVVWAIREGREAARAVDESLMGYTNLEIQ